MSLIWSGRDRQLYRPPTGIPILKRMTRAQKMDAWFRRHPRTQALVASLVIYAMLLALALLLFWRPME